MAVVSAAIRPRAWSRSSSRARTSTCCLTGTSTATFTPSETMVNRPSGCAVRCPSRSATPSPTTTGESPVAGVNVHPLSRARRVIPARASRRASLVSRSGVGVMWRPATPCIPTLHPGWPSTSDGLAVRRRLMWRVSSVPWGPGTVTGSVKIQSSSPGVSCGWRRRRIRRSVTASVPAAAVWAPVGSRMTPTRSARWCRSRRCAGSRESSV